MNALVRTLVIFVLLIGVVVGASLIYRNMTRATPDPAVEATPAPGPVDEAALHPELKSGLDAVADNREDEAIAHFSAVPAEDSGYATALRQLAILTARKGNFDAAVDSLLRLVAQRPDDPETHASLGWVFYLGDRHADAELAALRALELDPAHLSTRYNIGLYRVAQGRTRLAISSYIRAMRADPDGKQVIRHRDRLRSFHDAHEDLSGPHYALAFFANSMQDSRTEIDELDHFLAIAGEGPVRDAAVRQLDEARARMGG